MNEPPAARVVRRVLLAAGIIGILLGCLRYPSWQDALEPSQVLAGLVEYPADNPVYLYSVSTWTVLHQGPALLLSWGVTERTLAFILSGVMGALAFQSLGLITLALSGSAALAVLLPPFIVFANASAGGLTYPAVLMGYPFTYGIIGLSYLALIVGLIGVGRWPAAALLAGFGPAVHVTLGAAGILIALVTAVTGSPDTRRRARRAAPYFTAGLCAAFASALVHVLGPGAGAPPPGLEAAGQHWDEHRQPFPLLSGRALATYLSVAVAGFGLWRLRGDLPAHARDLLRALLVTAAIGGTLTTSYWLIPPDVPHLIPALMPSRLLNLNVMACMAVLAGLGVRHAGPHAPRLLAALVAALGALTAWVVLTGAPLNTGKAAWLAMGLYAAALAPMILLRRRTGDAAPSLQPQPHAASLVLLAAVFIVQTAVTLAQWPQTLARDIPEPASDTALAAAASRKGLLLTAADLHSIQLLTRRPVLLDGGALDAVIYAPRALSATDEILRTVYGTDLAAVRASRLGHLREGAGRELWEARSAADWQALRRRYGVTDVVTPADWTLNLPRLADSPALALYEIPPAADRP